MFDLCFHWVSEQHSISYRALYYGYSAFLLLLSVTPVCSYTNFSSLWCQNLSVTSRLSLTPENTATLPVYLASLDATSSLRRRRNSQREKCYRFMWSYEISVYNIRFGFWLLSGWIIWIQFCLSRSFRKAQWERRKFCNNAVAIVRAGFV